MKEQKHKETTPLRDLYRSLRQQGYSKSEARAIEKGTRGTVLSGQKRMRHLQAKKMLNDQIHNPPEKLSP